MNTPAPDWMPDASKATYPGWVQCKVVTLSKRDQKRGGVGNVQQYRLAIHEAVLASQGRDHWTGEWLDWELIGTYDNRDAATGKGENKKRYAMLPTIDHRTNQPEPDFVICAWRTNDAKHDMTPKELLEFCTAVLNHSPNWVELISADSAGKVRSLYCRSSEFPTGFLYAGLGFDGLCATKLGAGQTFLTRLEAQWFSSDELVRAGAFCGRYGGRQCPAKL